MAADRARSHAVQVLRWLGLALTAAALIYCGRTVARLGAGAFGDTLSPQSWAIAGGLGLAYGAALALLASGWTAMARGSRSLTVAEGLAIYGPAVLAKYIPGSVFQYGSRQLRGARFGLAQKAMAQASLAEAAMHVPSALLCAAVLLGGASVTGLAGLAGCGGLLALLGGRPLVRAAGWQLIFFAVFAALILLIAQLTLEAGDPQRLTGAFMLAWVAGFLVPVAPGGIGIRESVLLALAMPGEGTAAVAAFAGLTRLVTTLGDAAMGLAGYSFALPRRPNRQASA